MNGGGRSPFGSALGRWLSTLRHPQLVLVLAALLALDVVIPDPVPFLDEIVLGVLTMLAASWRRRGSAGEDGPRAPGKE